jgi:hypothetical protein
MMKPQSRQIIFIAVVGLAAIGLLTTNPWQLLKMIGMVVLFAIIFYFVFRFFQRRSGSTWADSSRYRKAAVRSKKRFKHQQKGSAFIKKQSSPTSLKRKSNPHLTVIEGKKNNKKKNRALH